MLLLLLLLLCDVYYVDLMPPFLLLFFFFHSLSFCFRFPKRSFPSRSVWAGLSCKIGLFNLGERRYVYSHIHVLGYSIDRKLAGVKAGKRKRHQNSPCDINNNNILYDTALVVVYVA